MIGITLDLGGWADVSELLSGLNQVGHEIDMTMLEEIVYSNDKNRYVFSNDKTKIRANQGHSIKVDLGLLPAIPPDALYHGTAERFCVNIMRDGLLKQKRNHVHLSKDYGTAIAVGKRYGKPTVLLIDAKSMYYDGCEFYLSENDVWLTDFVAKKYIQIVS